MSKIYYKLITSMKTTVQASLSARATEMAVISSLVEQRDSANPLAKKTLLRELSLTNERVAFLSLLDDMLEQEIAREDFNTTAEQAFNDEREALPEILVKVFAVPPGGTEYTEKLMRF